MDDSVYEVQQIIKKRIREGKVEYFLKWKGYNEKSWEPEENILDTTLIEIFEEKERNEHKPRKRGRKRLRPESPVESVPSSRSKYRDLSDSGDESTQYFVPLAKRKILIKRKLKAKKLSKLSSQDLEKNLVENSNFGDESSDNIKPSQSCNDETLQTANESTDEPLPSVSPCNTNADQSRLIPKNKNPSKRSYKKSVKIDTVPEKIDEENIITSSEIGIDGDQITQTNENDTQDQTLSNLDTQVESQESTSNHENNDETVINETQEIIPTCDSSQNTTDKLQKINQDSNSNAGNDENTTSVLKSENTRPTDSNQRTIKTIFNPGYKYWKMRSPVADKVVVTDVVVDLKTVTIRECATEKGFFKEKPA